MESANFSFEKVRELLVAREETITMKKGYKKSQTVIEVTDACKTYIGKYFFTVSSGLYYFWDASQKNFDVLNKKIVDELYFNKMPEEVKTWFFTKSII